MGVKCCVHLWVLLVFDVLGVFSVCLGGVRLVGEEGVEFVQMLGWWCDHW